uniref:Uncharacterized protein n=1 Tax=Leersia perrieri TaxID=77586 RepID=A0A0D9XDJ4_9ORYZ
MFPFLSGRAPPWSICHLRSSRGLGRRRRPLGFPSPPASTVVAGAVTTPSFPDIVLVSFLESHYTSCMHLPAQIEPGNVHAPAPGLPPPPTPSPATIPDNVGHGVTTIRSASNPCTFSLFTSTSKIHSIAGAATVNLAGRRASPPAVAADRHLRPLHVSLAISPSFARALPSLSVPRRALPCRRSPATSAALPPASSALPRAGQVSH